jgi:non-heme chloroperoxidase
MEGGLKDDRDAFFDQFTTMFFSAGDEPKVSETERQEAVALAGSPTSARRSAAWRRSGRPTSARTCRRSRCRRDAPHGLNASHADEFNAALPAFLAK